MNPFTAPQRRSMPSGVRGGVNVMDFLLGMFGGELMSDDEEERGHWDDDDDDDEYESFGSFLARQRMEIGPFAPGQLPSNSSALSHPACPHCKWHNNINGMQTNNDQRCFKCGRVATTPRVSNQYRHNFVPKDTNHKFGTREVSFRIVARDVRKDAKYRNCWEQADKNDQNWQYNEQAMLKSVYDFRIGKRPKVLPLLGLISEWDEETSRQKNEDCIIVDYKDIALLRAITELSFGDSYSRFQGDVTAVWDALNSVGVSSFRSCVQVFLSQDTTKFEVFRLSKFNWSFQRTSLVAGISGF